MIGRYIERLLRKTLLAAVLFGGFSFVLCDSATLAEEILGTGTASLIGNDLTDLGDDGDPEADIGYDAIFDASDEPGFAGGEFAFNVFDNRLGPSNDKWCCGVAGGIFEDEPIWVSAQLPVPHFLTSFTVSSANDVPERDPTWWAVQGSNDGQDYTDIFVYDDFSPWDERLQVIQWSDTEDFPVQTESYEYFRLATFNTDSNPNGAYFQIGEIEYFGTPDGEIPPLFVGGEDTIGTQSFEGDQSNEMFGPEQTGVSGWSGRIVTNDESGQQLDNHTIALDVLDDFEGEKAVGAYAVVDLAGGGGTFPDNLPYPNGVNDANQNDFVVEVTADVTIPAGEWTIGFGSDDGGRLLIEGVVFDDFQNNDNFQDDEIRFDGNRGHGWTVGTFQLDEDLETTITASFHERGGGDSFEIAVLDEAIVEDANPGTGWELLGDGTFNWSVKTTTAPLVSADLTAEVRDTRAWQFDVNGDTDAADQFVVDNPDSDVFTTILNVEGVTFEIKGIGALAAGDRFDIINADQVMGTPIITSAIAGQTWAFDATTGEVCFSACGATTAGDYNGDGVLDAADLDLQAAEIKAANPDLAKFDHNSDGVVNSADRTIWVKDLKGTWIGDANLDDEFNSGDLVAVFSAGKYEQDTMAGWAEGDWDGDMLFGSGDLVAAFSDGGYEMGPAPAAPAVPEPSSLVLALLSILGVVGVTRRHRK